MIETNPIIAKYPTPKHNEPKECLKLFRLPGRLDTTQAGAFLGFQPHDIPVLVAAGLLKPLGKPAANGQKYFATCELEEHRADRKWLDDASRAINQYWQRKNGTLCKAECRQPSPNSKINRYVA